MRGGAIFSARSATRDKMVFQFDFPFPTCSLHCLLRLFSDKRNGRHGPRASQMFLTRSLSPGAPTIPVPLDFSISTFTQTFSLAQHWTRLFLSNQIFQKIKNSLINQSSNYRKSRKSKKKIREISSKFQIE